MYNTVLGEVLLLKSKWTERRKLEQPYELSAELICPPSGVVTSNKLLIPSNGAFLMEGYNISYDADTTGLPTLQIKLSDESGNIPFSPDFVPIELVATPGLITAANPPIRYGFRPWMYLFSAKTVLNIEVRNTSIQATSRMVRITVSGRLLRAL